MSKKVVPFGKYKGQPLEVLAADPDYAQWMIQTPRLREQHPDVYTIVINNFQEPNETPEHNALQVLFLEQDYREAFIRHIGQKTIKFSGERQHHFRTLDELISIEVNHFKSGINRWIEERRQNIAGLERNLTDNEKSLEQNLKWLDDRKSGEVFGRDWHERDAEDAREAISNIKSKLEEARGNFGGDYDEYTSALNHNTVVIQTDARFEVKGVDVILKAKIRVEQTNISPGRVSGFFSESPLGQIAIELKPSVGDDYPTVLRQMDAGKAKYLFLQSYTGVGANLDQFRKTFEASGKTVVFRHEVEAILNANKVGQS